MGPRMSSLFGLLYENRNQVCLQKLTLMVSKCFRSVAQTESKSFIHLTKYFAV